MIPKPIPCPPWDPALARPPAQKALPQELCEPIPHFLQPESSNIASQPMKSKPPSSHASPPGSCFIFSTALSILWHLFSCLCSVPPTPTECHLHKSRGAILFLLSLQLPDLYLAHSRRSHKSCWLNEWSMHIHCLPSSLCLECSLSSSLTQLTPGTLRLVTSSREPSWNPRDKWQVFFLCLLILSEWISEPVNITAFTNGDIMICLCGFSSRRLLEISFIVLSLAPSSILAHSSHSIDIFGMNGWVKWINLFIIPRRHLPTYHLCMYGVFWRWLREKVKSLGLGNKKPSVQISVLPLNTVWAIYVNSLNSHFNIFKINNHFSDGCTD